MYASNLAVVTENQQIIMCDLEAVAHKFGLSAEDGYPELTLAAKNAGIRSTVTRDVAARTCMMVDLWKKVVGLVGADEITSEKIAAQAGRPASLAKAVAAPLSRAVMLRYEHMLNTLSVSAQFGKASPEARCLRSFSKRLTEYSASPGVRFWLLAPLGHKLLACIYRAAGAGHDWSDKGANYRLFDGLIRSEVTVDSPPAKRQRKPPLLPLLPQLSPLRLRCVRTRLSLLLMLRATGTESPRSRGRGTPLWTPPSPSLAPATRPRMRRGCWTSPTPPLMRRTTRTRTTI